MLVCISGAFPPRDHLQYLVEKFPGASVIVVHMPGFVVTPWRDIPPTDLARGFDEMLGYLFPGRAIVLFGSSTGNLLALGARSPDIVGRVALEPFFATANLHPFIAYARERLADNPDHTSTRDFLRIYFGITENAVENRDYSCMIDNIVQPTHVLAGAELMKPGSLEWNSFLEPRHREALLRNPFVTLHVGPAGSGHNFGSNPGKGRDFLDRVLLAELLRAAKIAEARGAAR